MTIGIGSIVTIFREESMVLAVYDNCYHAMKNGLPKDVSTEQFMKTRVFPVYDMEEKWVKTRKVGTLNYVLRPISECTIKV